MRPDIPFTPFPKIARHNRTLVVTEKIDGTNAGIYIPEGADSPDQVYASSRKRWITVDDDNFGFARFVQENADDLLTLGPGMHFGEWYGSGIQRGYGLTEKRFALFNSTRWQDGRQPRPFCCGVVPILGTATVDALDVGKILELLRTEGSAAVPGFMRPEGIVLYHTASRTYSKITLENDGQPKSMLEVKGTT
jgi:hypothetical protein